MGGVVFGDYHVSPNFLLCWVGVGVVVEVGLGCDNYRSCFPSNFYRKIF